MKVQIGCELIDTGGGVGGILGVSWSCGGYLWGVPPQPTDLYTPVSDHGGEGQVPAVIESSNGITFDTLCTEMYSLIKVQASVYKIVLTIYLTYGTLKYDFYFLI